VHDFHYTTLFDYQLLNSFRDGLWFNETFSKTTPDFYCPKHTSN